jgi:hypothetical protein
MALLTRDANAGPDAVSISRWVPQLAGDLFAGEALDICAPCYIKTTDGKIYMSDGTAANEAAEVVGFTPKAYAAGESVTLYGNGMRVHYSDGGLTLGAGYYLAATAGRLDTAATTGGTAVIAIAYNANDLQIGGLPAGY